ncbi:hypothetical protein QTH97_34850 [Variovorax sp. J22R24]|uniref:hypothetical protein n=1 Tax=Variovorax gracilis TaxID=3053502 RepID=UPI0025750841|nr:hypothetical protein [Variovorax sp. J22R24]MDM0110120.1 hypothetical protein [Variovorax sp. J22R24]
MKPDDWIERNLRARHIRLGIGVMLVIDPVPRSMEDATGGAHVRWRTDKMNSTFYKCCSKAGIERFAGRSSKGAVKAFATSNSDGEERFV